MVGKLSSQLDSRGETRTERRIVQESRESENRNAEFENRLEQVSEKLKSAKSVEEYERIYSGLSPSLRSAFISPTKLREEISKPSPELQQRISSTEQEIKVLETRVKNLQRQSEEISNRTGESPRSIQAQIESTGREADELKQRLIFLKSSKSVSEAQERERISKTYAIEEKYYEKQMKEAKATSKTNEGVIFVNGQGFSVAPSLQEEFKKQYPTAQPKKESSVIKAITPKSPEQVLKEFKEELKPIDLGGVFLTKAEAESRGIKSYGMSSKEELTKEQKSVQEAIKLAEEVTGVKDSGVVYVPASELGVKKVGLGKQFERLNSQIEGESPKGESLGDYIKRTKTPEYMEKELMKDVLPEDVLSFKELYSQRNLPAMFRKTSRIVGEELFKLSGEISYYGGIAKEKPTKYDITKGGKFLGEAGLYAFFTPETSTTTQIEMELAKETGVVFKGIIQKLQKDVLLTETRFMTTEGEKGVAVGVSKVKDIGKILSEGEEFARLQISKTYGFGTKGKPNLKFKASGLDVGFKDVETFGGIVKGGGIVFDKTFVQTSKGLVAKSKDKLFETAIEFPTGRLTRGFPKGIKISEFESGTLGLTEKEFTLLVSRAQTEGRTVKSLGLLKQVEKPTKDVGSLIKEFKAKTLTKTPLSKTFQEEVNKQIINQKIISQSAVSDLQAIIKESVQKQPLPSITPKIAPSLKGIQRMFGGAGLTEEQILKYAYKGGLAEEEFEPIKLPKAMTKGLNISMLNTMKLPAFKTQDLNKLLTRTLAGLKLQSKLETDLMEKQRQRQRLRLKEEQKIEDVLKERLRQRLRLKQSTKMRLNLRQVSVSEFAIPSVTFPTIIPTVKIGLTPLPIVLGKQNIKMKKLLRKRKQKQENIFAFVEGFTARAIALPPVIIKEENISKLIRQIRTPFRIPRRPVIVK